MLAMAAIKAQISAPISYSSSSINIVEKIIAIAAHDNIVEFFNAFGLQLSFLQSSR